MMTDRLSPVDLATLKAAQQRARRAEINLRAAQAELELCLLNLQEAYDIGLGDKLNPSTGEVTRAAGGEL